MAFKVAINALCSFWVYSELFCVFIRLGIIQCYCDWDICEAVVISTSLVGGLLAARGNYNNIRV